MGTSIAPHARFRLQNNNSELVAFQYAERSWLVMTRWKGIKSFWCWSVPSTTRASINEEHAVAEIAEIAAVPTEQAFIDAALSLSPDGWEFWGAGVPSVLHEIYETEELFKESSF